MLHIFLNKNSRSLLFVLMAGLLFSACEYDVRELAPKPQASFTVTPVSGQVNKYLLTANAPNAFRYDWNKDGSGFKTGKQIDTVYFPDKGTYTVKLLVYGHGGMDSTSQSINVAADDPAAQTPYKLLTGNSSKTWKLAPQAGALWIGPTDYSQTWWANSLGDVNARSCLFNDEYTFTKTGNVFSFKSKGDFYVDEENGNPWPTGMPAVGCYANNAIPAQYQAWVMDNNFTFEVINQSKLKVIGTGAHMALYKAATPPDAAVSTPQASITYDIVSITATKLVLKLDYGWGLWQFTFVAV